MMDICGLVCSFIPDSVKEIPLNFFKRQYIYLFKHQSTVKNLNEQIEKLKAVKERVQQDVESATRDGKNIHDDVRNWLVGVDRTINPNKTKELNQAVEQAKARCLLGLCPSFRSRRRLSKKAEQEAADVEKLLKRYSEADNFTTVGIRPALQGIRPALVQEFDAFESRSSTLEGIKKALKDPNVARIGVHGMPGVGKTMLVQKIGSQVRDEQMFHEVAMATVSSRPETRRIQGEISDALGLKFDAETESGRADQLCKRLNNGQKILVILDDIWDELKLEEIGISFDGAGPSVKSDKMLQSDMELDGQDDSTMDGCKIVMISRSQHVLGVMKSDKSFDVGILSSQEAEVLFAKIVGDVASQPDYKPIANEVIGKCAGLPVAITAVAKALQRSKSLDVWQDVRHKLRSSKAKKIDGVEQSVYAALELSYEMLRDKEAQQLFLLCGMYPQGADINVSDLLRYSVGLDLFDDVGTLNEAKSRVTALLHKLKASSLLLKGDADEMVKMHDLFREVSIDIAGRDPDSMFVIKDETDLKGLSKKGKLSHSTHISFLSGNIHELPDELDCPKLVFLKLLNNSTSWTVPDHFFQQMTELKVPDLEGMKDLTSLPSSFLSLTNLQTLCLSECFGMRDMSIISRLQQLDILSFRGSDIEELSGDMMQLTQLRLLDLSECSKLKVIPKNFFSGLTRLEELYMGNSFSQWGVQGNANLSELKNLSKLKVLQVHIFQIEMIPRDFSFEKLVTYRIFIGDGWNRSDKYVNSRQLKLKVDKNIHLIHNVKKLLDNTEDLCLHKLEGLKNVLYELGSKGFLRLKNLCVQNNSSIQYLVNFTEWFSNCKSFPSLESLILNGLDNLEKICHGQPNVEALGRLRIIKVRDCGKLKSLLTFSVPKFPLQLEDIEVTDCDNLIEILGGEMIENTDAVDGISDVEFLKQVRSLTLQ